MPKKKNESKKKGKKENSKGEKTEISKIKKESQSTSLNKKYLAILPIIIIICIAIFLLLPTSTSEPVDAQLIIDEGSVQVKHLGTWTEATNGMDLYQSDTIKTGSNATASIILFKGNIIRLDKNTEITLKEVIQKDEISVTIQQDAGRTWNTVKKISGIDNYEVETPTTVASVRGTSFDVEVDEGITVVRVINGSVNISKTENGTVYTIELKQNWSVTVDYDEIGEEEEFEVDEWIEDNLLEDETFKGELKDIIYAKIEPYFEDLKSLYGMTDEEIEVLIEGFINGDFPIPPETPEKYKKLFDLS